VEHRSEFPPQDRLLVDAATAATLTQWLQLLRTATDRFPSYWPAWYMYGVELVHRGPYLGTTHDEAHAALERTVALNPDLASAWDRLGWVASARRDTAGITWAIREMSRAMKGAEFRSEVPRIATVYTYLLRFGPPEPDTLAARVEWIVSGHERLVLDFGVELLAQGAPDVRLALSPPARPPEAALKLYTDPVAPVDPPSADHFDQTPAFDDQRARCSRFIVRRKS
jgi:hypothetical protein